MSVFSNITLKMVKNGKAIPQEALHTYIIIQQYMLLLYLKMIQKKSLLRTYISINVCMVRRGLIIIFVCSHICVFAHREKAQDTHLGCLQSKINRQTHRQTQK